MNQPKNITESTPQRKPAKTPENPATMRVSEVLLQHDSTVLPKIPKNRPRKSPQWGRFQAVFHRDPSLPISVSRPFSSA